MIHKLFDQPKYHDAHFYRDREVSDHLHESAHRGRLLRSLHDVLYLLDFDRESETVGDFGCGNGGLLCHLREKDELLHASRCWGYDLSPKAIEWATERYRVKAECLDFTNGTPICIPDIAVMTETLEHLVDPPAFLTKLKSGGVRWVVASCPLHESPEHHYEFHLWAWDAEGFKKLFREAGFYLFAHYGMVGGACQHIIALNKESLTVPLPVLP